MATPFRSIAEFREVMQRLCGIVSDGPEMAPKPCDAEMPPKPCDAEMPPKPCDADMPQRFEDLDLVANLHPAV